MQLYCFIGIVNSGKVSCSGGVLELHAVGHLTDIPLVSPPWQVVWQYK